MENFTADRQLQPSPKHSGLGIASFVISLAMAFFLFLIVLAAAVIATVTRGDMPDTSPAAVIVGLVAVLGLFGCVVGIGLGIAGMFQKNRKKVFSILGLIINGLIVLGVFALIVVGSLVP